MLDRHQVQLCGGSAADRAASIQAVLPGQEADLPSLQPLLGCDREVRGRDGRESHRAGEGAVRAVPEEGGLGGGRHPERFSDLAVRGAAQHRRQGALRRGGADGEELPGWSAVLILPQQLLLLQVQTLELLVVECKSRAISRTC